jgi:hypothetical protein
VQRVDSPEVVHLPIACTLGPDDGAARLQRWKAVSARGRLSARRSGHRLEIRYQPVPGLREELDALTAAERQCCSFAKWTVTQEEGHVILHIAADAERPDDITALAALFGAD